MTARPALLRERYDLRLLLTGAADSVRRACWMPAGLTRPLCGRTRQRGGRRCSTVRLARSPA